MKQNDDSHSVTIQIDIGPIEIVRPSQDEMIELVKPNFKSALGTPSLFQSVVMRRVAELSGIEVKACMATAYVKMGFSSFCAKGWYIRPTLDPRFQNETVLLNLSHNDPYFNSVLFHELAHASGHVDRLNRLGIGQNPMAYSQDLQVQCQEEIIAESTAYRLMKHFGLLAPQVEAQNLQYIEHYQSMAKLIPKGIDLEFCKKQSDLAFEYVLENWLAEFDTSHPKFLERLKERHNYF